MSQSVVKCQKEPEEEEEEEDVKKKKARRALLPGDALVGMLRVGLACPCRRSSVPVVPSGALSRSGRDGDDYCSGIPQSTGYSLGGTV